MKNVRLLVAIAVLSLSGSAAMFAQPPDPCALAHVQQQSSLSIALSVLLGMPLL